MANPTGAFGLRPLRHRNGAPYNGATVPCYVSASYATALFIGDPVIYDTTLANKDTTGNRPTIIKATLASGNLHQGVIVSFEPLQSDLSKQYNPASTERIANVCFDEDIIYAVRGDGVGTAPSKVTPGQNAILVQTAAGSTTTGLSGCELDESSATTTQAHTLHIIGKQPVENNELGSDAIWEVVLNTPELAAGKFVGITAA